MIAKIFVLVVILALAYQASVFRRFYPIEALFVAGLLAICPYLLL